MLTLMVAMSVTAAPASEPSSASLTRLDGFARSLARSERFSGVVLVARHGRIVLHRAYGSLDEQTGGPITPDSRFNIASAGKMFTAVAVLQLVADGRLGLDTTVGTVIEDYPEPTVAAKVTVRHLLTHTAGVGDLDIFGSEQRYGNFGHVILGRMVELISGLSFDRYLEQHVFAPARMSNTGSVECTAPDADIARGYAVVSGQRVINCVTQPARGFPAGGHLSTAVDLLRFVSALQSGRLLPRTGFVDATRTHRDFMGLGFFATGYGPNVPRRDFRWGHGGSTDGACTDVRSYPLTGETIIVLSNRDAPACFEIANFLHTPSALKPR